MKKLLVFMTLFLLTILIFVSCKPENTNRDNNGGENNDESIKSDSGNGDTNTDIGGNSGSINENLEHSHSFGKWASLKNPTCTERGIKVRVCSCGEQDNIYVKANGHNVENGICITCGATHSVGLEFTSNGDGTCYISGIGVCTDSYIIIPNVSPDGDKVTGIGKMAFNNCKKLVEIDIPETVTFIGEYAFSSCSELSDIEIPNSITSIGDFAFFWCNLLVKVVIGNGVESISQYAFRGCVSLADIAVNETNIHYKSMDGNLYSKDGQRLIQYAIGKSDKEFIIPDGTTTIGEFAFWNSKLERIVINDSVTTIGDESFYYCNKLSNITVNKENANYKSVDGNLFSSDGKTLKMYAIGKQNKEYVISPDVTRVDDSAFYGCETLTSVIIGDNVTSIGKMAFKDCSNITSIMISNSVTSIDDGAFFGCTNLTSVTIPNSVTSIGAEAFSDCTSLTSVVIPDVVTSIGEYAFYNCTSLTDVYYTGTEEEWAAITIGSGNEKLTVATIHYNYVPEE